MRRDEERFEERWREIWGEMERDVRTDEERRWVGQCCVTHLATLVSTPAYLTTLRTPERVPRKAASTPGSTLHTHGENTLLTALQPAHKQLLFTERNLFIKGDPFNQSKGEQTQKHSALKNTKILFWYFDIFWYFDCISHENLSLSTVHPPGIRPAQRWLVTR